MLYGWIEIGLSNNAIFNYESNQDIILRTIYDNKIILGNTYGVGANAAIYLADNNVGIQKVPQSNICLDVGGDAFIEKSLTLAGSMVLQSNVTFSLINTSNTIEFTYSNVNRMKLTTDSGVIFSDAVTINNDIYANTYNLTSDIRFKTNVHTSDPEKDVEILKDIKVRNYNFVHTQPQRPMKGFIAQELEQVFPQAVCTNISKDGMKTIDTNQIIALNTSTLQSILTRLEQLEKYVYENK